MGPRPRDTAPLSLPPRPSGVAVAVMLVVDTRVPSPLLFVFYIMAPPTIDADGRFRRALWSGTHPSRGLRSGPLGVVEAEDAIWRARILWSLALPQAGGRTARSAALDDHVGAGYLRSQLPPRQPPEANRDPLQL